MAYNRWINDDLEHSGVLYMKWHHKNGPPYPLDRSLSDGKRLLPKATGSPQGKKRTPARGGVSKSGKKDQIHSDYGDSLAARAIRKYGEHKAKRAEERARAEEKEKKLYTEQSDRLNKLNITKETRERLEDDAKYYQESHGASKGSALKRALDDYEKRTSDIKEHGTADEVLKNRERFSKEDMEYISRRLEAEAKVQKYSSKPVEQIKIPKTERDLIYETASAKEVYRNRSELTVEQLETVQRRLNAENQIGEIASKQVDLDSRTMERLKKARDVLKVLGESADSIQKIQKIFPSKNNQNQNQNNQNQQNNKVAKAVETGRKIIGLVNVVKDVSDSYNQNFGNQSNKQQNQQQQPNQQNNKQQNQQQQSNQQNKQQQPKQDNKQQQSQSKEQNNNKQQQPKQDNKQQQNQANKQQSQSKEQNNNKQQQADTKASKSQQSSSSGSNTKQRSSVSDLIDRLSTIELVMTDESRNGKVDPLERIGRTFTDEERKKR